MTWNRALLATVSGSLFLTLTACTPVLDDSQSDFYVASIGQRGTPGYSPQGWGWKSGSKVSIDIWGEPTAVKGNPLLPPVPGPGSVSTDWKHILDVDVDNNGMFGFTGTLPFYPVKRGICGNPEQGQTMTFMAKNLTTGRIRMFRAPVDQYYTFQPCP